MAEGRMSEWMNGRMNEWADGQTQLAASCLLLVLAAVAVAVEAGAGWRLASTAGHGAAEIQCTYNREYWK